MKKCILLIVSLLFITALSFAQRTDLSGLTLVIDPGHGGHNPENDRHIIPDPGVNFWESEGNFHKALFLDTLLTELGAKVILTRYTNDYPDDRLEPSLTARVQVANSNNATWFHSIHSNGFNGTTNYTVILYRTNSAGQPATSQSVDMSNIIAQHIYRHNRTTSTRIAGDYGFLTYNLGVLNGLQMPGELSEGSFHDFFPETRRLMNMEYKKSEAYALRNSFMEYFGVPKDTLCIVAGVINDISVAKPVNNVKVILEPLGLVYNGDNYNNGYYFFDKIPAGNYTVIFDTEGYSQNSINFSLAKGDLIRFIDMNASNTIPPTVSTPLREGDTTISVTATFAFTFSKVMDKTSVQNAISFSPSAECSFTWSNNDMTVTVRPAMPLLSRTNYTVTISSSAKDIGGIELEEPITRNFKTLPADEERPVIIAHYPLYNPPNIFRNFHPQGTINIAFNKLMDTASLQNAILLKRGSVNRERALWFDTIDEKTIVTLKPSEPMDINASYVVQITTDAKDTEGNSIRAAYNLAFFTANETYKAPTTLESFAGGIGGWWQPSASGSTTGVYVEKTNVSLENNIYYPFTDNNRSMRLNYSFMPNTTNLLRVHLASGNAFTTLIDADPSKRISSFVFGDGSKNRVRFCVYDDPLGANAAKASSWVTIDWYGWRLVEWNFTDPNEISSFVSNDPILGPQVVFEGYHVQHDVSDEHNLEGTLYFDELRITELETSGISVPEFQNNVPDKFSLEQNYPNPFNPSTNLQLNISEKSQVKLVIYDLLGREVSVLKDEVMNPGTYKVTWNAAGLPSGVYFAKLYSGTNISTIKMILAK